MRSLILTNDRSSHLRAMMQPSLWIPIIFFFIIIWMYSQGSIGGGLLVVVVVGTYNGG